MKPILSVYEIKDLEYNSEPIFNFLILDSELTAINKTWLLSSQCGINWGVDKVKTIIEKCSKKIGFVPHYYVNRQFARTAVYGVISEGHKFIIYCSRRGIEIQSANNPTRDAIKSLLLELMDNPK